MRYLAILGLLASLAVHDIAQALQAPADYWMNAIPHNGLAPFNADKSYKIFRNVKDYGAKGDGVTDDTAAINLAMSSGGRCGGQTNCVGSTTTPAVVYFPAGTYMISSSILDFYYTQIIGDPNHMPTIKATSNFVANIIGMLDADVYVNGKLKYTSTNVFFRQLRNIRFDTTDVPGAVTAVHWPSAQATSILNCVFVLSPDPSRHHTGIFMEEGSGGFIGDLVFYGGEYGCQLGNQQYTMRNMTFFNSKTAILQIWNWAWTYKSIFVYNCEIGLNMSGPIIGSVSLLDSGFFNTPTGIISGRSPGTQAKPGAGSLVMENVAFQNVTDAVLGPNGTIIDGNQTGEPLIKRGFVYGNTYVPNGPNVNLVSDDTYFPEAPDLRLSGRYYERTRPQYSYLNTSQILCARAHGVKGDGVTDDTDALNAFFALGHERYQDSVAFVDAGYYLVTDTIRIPPNVRIVGEALASVILGTGPKFQNMSKPHPVVQVGRPGEHGYVEWSDMIVSTQGPAAGAVLIEYNLETYTGPCIPSSPPSGMWDVHVRVGGFAGSNLQLQQCAKTPQLTNNIVSECIGSYLSMHITKYATNLYMENNWFWVADHDIEDAQSSQISVYGGRGLLVEASQGVIWMVASCAEHHTKYQYQLVNTQSIWMGMIQTETPYYQPNPAAPAPFTYVDAARHDPDFNTDCQNAAAGAPCAMAWGLRVINSTNISVYGAGLYSFFNNYDTSCSAPGNGEICQARMVYTDSKTGPTTETDGTSFGVDIYNLNTIGSVSMIQHESADVAMFRENVAGYTSCVALFHSGLNTTVSDPVEPSGPVFTMIPTTTVPFPLPVPGQTNCNYTYVW